MVSAMQRAILEEHIAAERVQDMDRIMATLSPRARYVVPGFLCEGKPALRAMYERSRWALTSANADEYLRALGDPAVCRESVDHIVLEYDARYPLHAGMAVVIHFDGDLLLSENTYLSRPLTRQPDDTGRAEFLAVPGVSAL